MVALKKCVIPAAGRGTRLLPLSKKCPKEMLKVGDRPMIHWVFAEALASGITEICLISNPRKWRMEVYLRELLSQQPDGGVSFCCLEQEEPLGLGRALLLAREFIGSDPFVLMLPDNLISAGKTVVKQMEPSFRKYGLSVNALMEVASPRKAGGLGNTGRVEVEEISRPLYRIKEVQAKGKGGFVWHPGERNYRLYPRAILLPEVFEYGNRLCPPLPVEFDDTPIFQKMVTDGRVLGYQAEAEVFDAGNRKGLKQARRFYSARKSEMEQ